jgi:hypothetical protein
MRKLHALWMALFAVLALGVLASPAFAEETQPLWLWNGAGIETGVQLLIESTWLFLSEDLNFGTVIHCEGSFDGWVGANGEDGITEVLTALKELLAGLEPGQDLIECTTSEGGQCLSGGIELDVETVGLPWATLLELVGSSFMDDFTSLGTEKLLGYAYGCLTIIGEKLDICTTKLAEMEIMNEPETTTTLFAENGWTCSIGGANSGDIESEGLIFHTGGGSITASQP